MILAKPVVKNKYWILKEDDRKIGTVENNRNGYTVRIADRENQFKSIRTLKNRTNIVFEESVDRKKAEECQVNGFPTNCKPHNAVFNVQTRLPIFTKKNKSKSWYAAGYFQITINGVTETHFCPKVILLNRYPYMGPAKDPDGFEFK